MQQTGRQRVYQDQDLWDKFWKDKHGRVVVWQMPNVFLIGWVVLTLASLFTNGNLATGLWWAALAVLAIWSLLEIFKGVNYLRRLLGLIVLAVIVAAIFKVGY